MINTVGKNLTLDMSSASAVMSALKDAPGLSGPDVAARAEIAEARANSVCSWLTAANWLKRNNLQPEGSLLLELDPYLTSTTAKALLLARLTTNVSLWAALINEYFHNSAITGASATKRLAMLAATPTQHRNEEQVRKDVGLVFSMLKTGGALDALGMLTSIGGDEYRVSPYNPSPALVAYLTLTDYPEPTQAVPFSWLTARGGPLRGFLLSGEMAEQCLAAIERSGLVTSERAHDFNRLVLRKHDEGELLGRAVNDSRTRT